jgi:hypothetical protein
LEFGDFAKPLLDALEVGGGEWHAFFFEGTGDAFDHPEDDLGVVGVHFEGGVEIEMDGEEGVAEFFFEAEEFGALSAAAVADEGEVGDGVAIVHALEQPGGEPGEAVGAAGSGEVHVVLRVLGEGAEAEADGGFLKGGGGIWHGAGAGLVAAVGGFNRKGGQGGGCLRAM